MAKIELYSDDQFLEDLAEMIEYFSKENGMQPGDSGALARAAASLVNTHLHRIYGGQQVYFDKLKSGDSNSEVAEKVRAAFDGCNQAEVLERFGISRASFYRYINKG